MMSADPMTARERAELAQLMRRREAVAKTAAKQRAAVVLARAEADLAATFRADDDRWAVVMAAAHAAVEAANAEIARVCREEGVPREFAPSLNTYWLSRGENGLKERRVELRRVAESRVKAMELAARTEIERRSVEAQTAILAGGLADGAARRMLDSLPSADALMPALAVAELEASAEEGRARRQGHAAVLMGGTQ